MKNLNCIRIEGPLGDFTGYCSAATKWKLYFFANMLGNMLRKTFQANYTFNFKMKFKPEIGVGKHRKAESGNRNSAAMCKTSSEFLHIFKQVQIPAPTTKLPPIWPSIYGKESVDYGFNLPCDGYTNEICYQQVSPLLNKRKR